MDPMESLSWRAFRMYCRRNNKVLEKCPEPRNCPLRFECLVWKSENRQVSKRQSFLAWRLERRFWNSFFRPTP